MHSVHHNIMEDQFQHYAAGSLRNLTRLHHVLDAAEQSYFTTREQLRTANQGATERHEVTWTEAKQQIQYLTNRLASEEQTRETLQAEVTSLRELVGLTEQKLALINKIEEHRSKPVSPQLKILRDSIAECQSEISALTAENQKCRDYLGLSIETTATGTRFAFTCIRREDPSQEHWVTLSVNDQRNYVLEACQPGLGTIEELMSELNLKNNLQLFLKQVRDSFVSLYL